VIRDLPESRLSGPVSAWWADRGFTVWAEVPFRTSSVDLVAWRPHEADAGPAAEPAGLLVAVELKPCLSREVIRQAMINQLFADRSYAAVAGRPRRRGNGQWCRDHGIGVLVVHFGRVDCWMEARPYPRQSRHARAGVIGRIAHMSPGGLAGLPCLAGCGPARECAARVEDYRRAHPGASWPEIFRAVPNHYAHAASLRAAMENAAKRRRKRG